ncbi:MAG: 8-oxo-dGTP diphosphatase [Thermoanaerobaculia bacterium]
MDAPRRIEEIDWSTWRPVDRATLVFVVRDGEILLIRKLRGLGRGKINGPGGRLEPGESPLECAVREVREELEIDVRGLSEAGELCFQFLDGYSIHVTVFRAAEVRGRPVATAEAIPHWTPVADIPYDEMWEDDRIWLPHLLDGVPFSGRFVFDDDRLLDWTLDPVRR